MDEKTREEILHDLDECDVGRVLRDHDERLARIEAQGELAEVREAKEAAIAQIRDLAAELSKVRETNAHLGRTIARLRAEQDTHTCPAPAVIDVQATEALAAIQSEISRFGAQVMPVGAFETGLRQACDTMDTVTKIAREALRSAPLANPTREEAIEALRQVRHAASSWEHERNYGVLVAQLRHIASIANAGMPESERAS